VNALTSRSSNETGRQAPRAWQRMLSGRRLDLLAPDPADIEIADIAHGLARVARWNGQTVGDHAFSVAQHVLIVEEIARETVQERPRGWTSEWQLAALLHDAAEYVVGDLISPFKNAIGLDYKAQETRLMEAIHDRFALPRRLPDDVARHIKIADTIAAYFEATRLAGFSVEEARTYFGTPPELPASLARELDDLTPQPSSRAQADFLARFGELYPLPAQRNL